MNQVLKSLADRLQAFPEEERENALRALDQRLAEIEAAKLEDLRRDIDAGLEQARNGQTVDGEEMFAKFKQKYAS